jgi:hypothetical protein
MSEEQTRLKSGDPEPDNKLPTALEPRQAATLLRQLIQKITDQPFLFVIAIALLLITFALQGAEVGGPEFRLVVLIIGLLAVFGMIGYYLMQLRLDPSDQKPNHVQQSSSPSSSPSPSLPTTVTTAPPERSPTPLPPTTPKQGIDAWVEALEQSPTMQNRDTRLAVYAELPPPIRNSLNANLPSLNAQLRDLVRTCQNYPDGLVSLVKAIRVIEDDSIAVQNLQSLLQADDMGRV